MEKQQISTLPNQLRRKISVPLMIIVAGFFMIFMMGIGSADLGASKVNTCVNIEVLSNSSVINLTEVTSPDSTYVINSPMQYLGGQTFNYSFCNTSTNGIYHFSWNDPAINCASSGTCGNSFQITPNGDIINTSTSMLYGIVFIICFGIFIGLLFLGIKTDGHNGRDETTGYIIALNNLKYFKMVCFGLAYIFGVFLAYFSWMMSYAYLNFDFVTNILKFVFYFLAIATLPLFLLFVYTLIANAVRDNKIGQQLSRGLDVNE